MTLLPFPCAMSLDTALMVLRIYADADAEAGFAEIVPLLQLRLQENEMRLEMRLEDIEMRVKVLSDRNDMLMDIYEQARNTVSFYRRCSVECQRVSANTASAADDSRSTLSHYDAGMSKLHDCAAF